MVLDVYNHIVIISIHTPHAGSDKIYLGQDFQNSRFQSTLPMRGVTIGFLTIPIRSEFQSTLPMRGVTHVIPGSRCHYHISIHTPHAGSDSNDNCEWRLMRYFNPHSPCGE